MTQNSAPATTTSTAAPPVRRVFVVITVQNSYGRVRTSSHELTVTADTRHEVLLNAVLAECVPEEMRGGVILHYSVHPAVIA